MSIILAERFCKKLRRHFGKTSKESWKRDEIKSRILELETEFLIEVIKEGGKKDANV